MEQLDTLRGVYAAYLEQAATFRRGRAKAIEQLNRIFGSRTGTEEEAANQAFYDAVKDCMQQLLAAGPTPEEAAEAAELIVLTPAEQEENSPEQWMLSVVVGLLGPVIPLLTQEECRRLYDWYGKEYPKRKCLPIQQEFYLALEARVK